MRYRIGAVILLLLIPAVLCTGCGKKDPYGNKVLARVSNRNVTLNEFNAKIAKMPPYYQSIVDKNKKRYLDDMILEMLLYEEATRKGLEHDKEVKELLQEAKKKVMITKLVKLEVEDNIKITDEEARKFYDANKNDFKSPEMWRASHILVSTEKEAKDILDSLAKGEKFDSLAKAHSTDATASRGGDIGYFREGQLVPDFEKAALKLKVGEVSDIVHTQFGYHIIKLTDKKESAVETFEKARRAIEGELGKKKRAELFDGLVSNLRKKYNVEIQDETLKALDWGAKGKGEAKK